MSLDARNRPIAQVRTYPLSKFSYPIGFASSDWCKLHLPVLSIVPRCVTMRFSSIRSQLVFYCLLLRLTCTSQLSAQYAPSLRAALCRFVDFFGREKFWKTTSEKYLLEFSLSGSTFHCIYVRRFCSLCMFVPSDHHGWGCSALYHKVINCF